MICFFNKWTEIFEDPIRIFYANLYFSKDSGELKTLVLGIRIILNDFILEKFFDTMFFGMVSSMNDIWPKNFEVSFEEGKEIVVKPKANLSYFGPLSLCFKHGILAHIITTSLIP